MWYFIEGSSVNRTFTGNESFNQNDWDGIVNGTLTTITFYANDTFGNIHSNLVNIFIDNTGPSISIISPSNNDILGSIAPVFNVTISDGNLDTMWYFIEGSSVNRTFAGNEAFNQNDWDGIINGTLTIITFYANDSFGNLNSDSVNIYVDNLPPIIIINSPSDNDVLGPIAPVFDVTITDGNLDTMWYFIEGSSVNRTFAGDEAFNQNDWSAIINGTLTTITFYANDSFGNLNSDSVNIYVDNAGPLITINSPNDNDVLGPIAPVFDVTISDGNLDTMWYYIEGSSLNRTFIGNEVFNQNDWDGIANGTLTIITFYANDTFGNENSQSVSIYVDNLSPTIIINSPNDNDVLGPVAPVFDVTITDGNLDTMWYFVEGSSENRTFGGNEAFNQNDWDGIINGTLTIITFYANDSFGNVNSQSVSIYVDNLAPAILINSPSDNDVLGPVAPVFDVMITDGNLDTMWYFIEGSSVNRTFTGNEAFNQNDWDGIINGTLTIITFYANDSFDNVNSQSVSIYVDNLAPAILINSPSDNDVLGPIAPVFDVTITDGNLDTMWYFIEGSSENRTFAGNEAFNQNDWNGIVNGTLITITFYANDSFGNVNSQSVSIYIDNLVPTIIINSPNDNDVLGPIAPVFDVMITDGNLDTMWYFIEGSSVNRTFTGNETFNQNDWDGIINGTLTIITFYANDSYGNTNSQSVVIFVDNTSPLITINSPTDNGVLGPIAPMFDVTITDGNLDTMWYFIEGSSVNRTFTGNEAFNQNDWDGIVNGTLTIITFYANDSFGSVNSQSISIYVDNTGPSISINSPNDNDVLGPTAPVFDVAISDGNLDIIWYFIEGSSINRTFAGNEAFNQNDWDSIINGTLTIITFYANDSFGNTNSQSVSIYVDNASPSININSPNVNEVLGPIAPVFDVTITDGNLDTMWYFIEGSSVNRTFTGNEAFNQNDWDNIANDTLTTITFYANDSFGNINSQSINIYVDNSGPSITINSPSAYDVFGGTAPAFDVTISDGNLNTTWYVLNNGTDWSEIFTFISPIDTINQDAWNFFANGTITITFYANDSKANIAEKNVLVYKDIISPIITIHDPEPGTLFGIPAPNINVTIYDDHLVSAEYQLDNGSVVTAFRDWTGFIHQEEWDKMGNGTVTLRFLAIDSEFNLNSKTLLLRKNIYEPIIIISNPLDNELFGSLPPNITLYTSSAAIDAIWYRIYNSTFSTVNITWSGSINMNAWDIFGNGTVSIMFYINDTLGIIGLDSVNLRKDMILPTVVITSPLPFELFGTTPPEISLIFYDDNSISSISYQLQNLATFTTLRLWTGSIILSDWNTMSNGTVTIIFRAEDIVGNIVFENVTVRKDIYAPIILFYDPDNGTLYAHDPPLVLFSISEGSGVANTLYQITNDTFSTPLLVWNNSIEQDVWDQFGNGTITIYIFVNDTTGNIGNASVVVRKDIIPPSIIIQSPSQYQEFGRDSPFFEVHCTDGNLQSSWYEILGTNVTIQFIGPFGRINQALWESMWDNLTVNGTITIRFYANDTIGNENFIDLYLNKFRPTTPITIISNPLGLIFSTLGLVVMVPITWKLTKSRYYQNLNKKEKSKLKKVLITAFVLLSVTILFYIF
jgi:hypothetical protein